MHRVLSVSDHELKFCNIRWVSELRTRAMSMPIWGDRAHWSKSVGI